MEFANPLLFRPSRYAGIAVLRLPPKAAAGSLAAAIETLASALERKPVAGQLWIIQKGRVREYRHDARSGAGP